MLKKTIFYLFMFALLLAFSLLTDRVLDLFGFPEELEPQLVHPPGFKEIRKSIDEFTHEFSTNSQGLRYPEISLKKADSREKRVLVVGDSFTEGWGVEQEQTFCALLESYYGSSNHSVYFICAGVTGAGPHEYLQLLMKLGDRYDVDAALFCLYANDVSNSSDAVNYDPGSSYAAPRSGARKTLHFLYPRLYTLAQKLKHYSAKKQYLSRKRNIINEARSEARISAIPEERFAAWQTRLPQRLVAATDRYEFNAAVLKAGLLKPRLYSAALDISTESDLRRWRNMNKILDLMADICRKKGLEVAFLFFPAPFQHNPSFHRPESIYVRVGMDLNKEWLRGESRLQQNLKKWAGEKEVRYLDLTPEFRRAENIYHENINYPLDHHWTPLGHKIAAAAIYRWLKKIKFAGFDPNE